MERLKTPEEYARSHQRAFRCAFDFLNAHFPPCDTPGWWEETAKDASLAADAEKNDLLATKLIIGVFDYLEHECKLRREQQ